MPTVADEATRNLDNQTTSNLVEKLARRSSLGRNLPSEQLRQARRGTSTAVDGFRARSATPRRRAAKFLRLSGGSTRPSSL